MNRDQIEDMAYQLLNISADTDEWGEDFLKDQIKAVSDQIEALKMIKERKSIFDLNFDLFDLLREAYETSHFEINY